MASSPAIYRRLTTLRPSTFTSSWRPAQSLTTARPFSYSVARADKKNLSTNNHVNTSNMPDDEHAMSKKNKGDALDPQSKGAQEGIHAKKTGTGGNATEERDGAGGVAKAKKEHPEAPDPAIGMQDQVGGRGG